MPEAPDDTAVNATLEVPDTPGAASSSRPAAAANAAANGQALSRCSCCRGRKQCGVWFRRGHQPGGKPQGGQLADQCPECRKDAPSGSCRCFCWECNYPDVWDPLATATHALPTGVHGSGHTSHSTAPVVDLTNECDDSESSDEADTVCDPQAPPPPPAATAFRHSRPYPWTRPMAPALATGQAESTHVDPGVVGRGTYRALVAGGNPGGWRSPAVPRPAPPTSHAVPHGASASDNPYVVPSGPNPFAYNPHAS